MSAEPPTAEPHAVATPVVGPQGAVRLSLLAVAGAHRHRVPVLPPLAALVELAVLCAAIMIADWLIPGIDIAEIQPNPYWVPVLLLSLQYGAVSGMLAAVVASIATIYAGFPEQGVGENYFTYFIRVWALPIVWLGVAIVFGQFRTRQIATKQALRREVEELNHQRAALAEHAGNLRARCQTLERDIAGREDHSPVLTLLDRIGATRGLGSEPQALLDGLVDAALPGSAIVLYRRAGVRYEPSLSTARIKGSSRAEPLAAPISERDAIADVAIQGRAVSVLDAAGERALAGRGIAAVPLGPGAGDGLLLLTRCPGGLVGPDLVVRLGVLADLIARSGIWQTAGEMRAARTMMIAAIDPVRGWQQRRWLPRRRPAAGGAPVRSAHADVGQRAKDA